jgi:signal transduction histidine kinase
MEEKAQNEVLSMTNATVSHELRNPLNSIQAQNILKKKVYEVLRAKIAGDQELEKLMDQLDEGLSIQESSTSIMGIMIQDLLDFSQIKSGKFRKIITSFNIRDTIVKVMDMQRTKAEHQGLKLLLTLKNIAETEEEAALGMMSPIISSDQDRLMQVLLGLQSNAIKFTQRGQVEIIAEIVEIKGRPCI